MTANAPGTNHPPRNRLKKAMKRQEELAAKLMEENPGLSREDAMARAQEAMRDSPRGDWRAG